jgi:hypothetical protein
MTFTVLNERDMINLICLYEKGLTEEKQYVCGGIPFFDRRHLPAY